MRKLDAPRRKLRNIAAEKSKISEHEEAWGLLREKCFSLYNQIKKTKAHTIAGIQIKVRAVKLVDLDMSDCEEWAPLSADILRLSA